MRIRCKPWARPELEACSFFIHEPAACKNHWQSCFGNDKDDRIDRIFSNFCNPWGKPKHKKRRLTHPRQLIQYKPFLRGELWFKTDDDGLFEETLEYLAETGFRVTYLTRDLHHSGFVDNLETEHERMFMEDGKQIKFLIAVQKRDA